MKKFIYPDKGDSLTFLFINSKSNEKYWEDSEKNILDKILQRISQLNYKPNFLDLGCGLGRLFSTFFPYVNSITGLEPDFERFSQAKEKAKNIDSSTIKVFNNDISHITNEKFDVVLVSHIFQHIPFEKICNILKRLSSIIPSEGVLLITTTYTDTENDIFTLEYLKENKHFSEPVSEKEFIERFNTKGILPVRNFSRNTMKKLFEENDFEIETILGYHFDVRKMNDLPTIEYDNEMNNKGLLENAKDVLYILRKK